MLSQKLIDKMTNDIRYLGSVLVLDVVMVMKGSWMTWSLSSIVVLDVSSVDYKKQKRKKKKISFHK
jgi:hypothetical protein